MSNISECFKLAHILKFFISIFLLIGGESETINETTEVAIDIEVPANGNGNGIGMTR